MVNQEKDLVLFDGVCNLCNGFIQFVIKRDKNKRFMFAPLQSKAGEEVLKNLGKSTDEFDSMLFVVDGRPMLKSSAVLHIMRKLGGLWSLSYGFIIVPRFLRNWVYDIVASNRYRVFGKRDACMIPTPELKARFLD